MAPQGQAVGSDPGYSVAGPTSGLCIVFVHGIRMNRGMWAPQMDALSDEFQVVAVDLPGHGLYREQEFSLEAACERLAEVIDEVARGRALVVGLSMGGFVCMDFIGRYPQKAIGAVLSGCTAQPRGPLTLPYWIGGALARALPEPVLSRANGWWLRAQFGDLAEPAIERGFGFRCFGSVVRSIAGQDFIERARQYHGPVLLLNGARDTLFGRDLKLFSDAIEDSRTEIIRGAGHLSSLQRPAEFTEAVRRFARRAAMWPSR